MTISTERLDFKRLYLDFLYLISGIGKHFFHFLKLLSILCLFGIGRLLHHKVIVWDIVVRKCWGCLLGLKSVIKLCDWLRIGLLEVIVLVSGVVIFLIIIFLELFFKVRLWVYICCFEIDVIILVLSSIFLQVIIILRFSLMLKLLLP